MVVWGRIVRFHPASLAFGAWTRFDRHVSAGRPATPSEGNAVGAMQRGVRHLAPIAIVLAMATLPASAQKTNVKVNQNQDTFVISNEAPGFLITKLINAGYGSDNSTKRFSR